MGRIGLFMFLHDLKICYNQFLEADSVFNPVQNLVFLGQN